VFFQIPHRNLKDKKVQENFLALESLKFFAVPAYPNGEAPNPPESGAMMYSVLDGSGKTRLMVQFRTGAAIQLAIEP
jgi:hypothetical protein